MPVFYEARHAGEFILTEANGRRSRENLTIAENQEFQAGTILALIAVPDAVTASVSAVDGNTGDGALSLADPAVSAKAKNGDYRVVCIEAAAGGGKFKVEDPSGVGIGTATVGTAFNREVKFTIAAGSTDFVVGDAFTITVGVEAGDYQAVAYDPEGADGGEVAGAIAIYGAKTGAGETVKIAGLVRDCEVNGHILAWPEGITAEKKAAAIAALADAGIIVR